MEREYYPLDKVAEIIGSEIKGFSVSDLVHLGSKKKLSIYILIGGFRLITHCIMSNREKHDDDTYEDFGYGKIMRLSWRCLFSLESQPDPDVMLARQPIYSYRYNDFEYASDVEYDEYLEKFRSEIGYRHYQIYRDGEDSPRSALKLQKVGVYPNFKPVKLSECKMVVLHSDLEDLRKKLGGSSLNSQSSIVTKLSITIDEQEEQEKQDRAAVHEIGRRLLGKYKDHNPPINCARAKKVNELKPFYEKYPGKDPVKVDQWLNDVGIPYARPGAPTKKEKEFFPTLE